MWDLELINNDNFYSVLFSKVSEWTTIHRMIVSTWRFFMTVHSLVFKLQLRCKLTLPLMCLECWMKHSNFRLLGLEEGRRFFREQANVPPMVLDFHLKMIEMETEAVHKDLQLIRKNFENACLLFGQNNLGKRNRCSSPAAPIIIMINHCSFNRYLV